MKLKAISHSTCTAFALQKIISTLFKACFTSNLPVFIGRIGGLPPPQKHDKFYLLLSVLTQCSNGEGMRALFSSKTAVKKNKKISESLPYWDSNPGCMIQSHT